MPLYEESCEACGIFEYYASAVTEETRACPTCGGLTERVISLSVPAVFEPFVTRNIARDGSPIEIRSHAQLAKACRENGVQSSGDRVPPSHFDPQSLFKAK